MSIITSKTKGSPLMAPDVDANFIFIAQVFESLGLVVKAYEPLDSYNWELEVGSNFRKLQLTEDTNLLTDGGIETGVYVLDVKQPANGGKLLTIDGHDVELNPLGSTKVIVQVGAFGKEYFSNVSIDKLRPQILSQTLGGTYLEGEYVDIAAEFTGADEYEIRAEGGLVIEGNALLIKASSTTAKAYVVIAKNKFGPSRSQPIFIRIGEPDPAKIILNPISASVAAGAGATLKADATGTPPPSIEWFEVVNGEDKSTGKTGKELTVTVLYTKTYVPVATNRYKVEVPVPAVLGPDGVSVVTPATTKLEYKTFTSRGVPATLTPIKQEQPAPNPIAGYDDTTDIDTFTLGQLHAGKKLSDLRIIIDEDQPITPTSMIVKVGDRDIPAAKINMYYVETDIYAQSPFTSSTAPFTAAPALQDVVFDSLDGVTRAGTTYTRQSDGRDTADGWGYSAICTTRKIAAGQPGYVTIPGLAINEGANNFSVGFKTVAENGGIKTQDAALYLLDRNFGMPMGTSYNKNQGYSATGSGLDNYRQIKLYRDADGRVRVGSIYDEDGTEYPQPAAFPADFKILGDVFVHICYNEKLSPALVSGIKVYNSVKNE